jgi:threonine 3-dehydrogenase
MKDKMLAVVKTLPQLGGTELLEVPVPTPGPNDVLLKVKICSICGTDVHIYNWDAWAQNRIKPPLLYGHEFAGEVVEVGKNVTHIKQGDYVSGECHIFCGHCYQCQTGMQHICANTKIFGVDRDGIFAEYACIPAQNIWKNDPALPLEFATIQDPLGNAVHTVFSADVPAKNVVILGLGPIGLLTVAVCKTIGASQIFAVGHKNEYRINLARKVGATHTFKAGDDIEGQIKEATGGQGADVVLEFTGDSDAVNLGLSLLKIGGAISLLGIFPKPFTTDLNKNFIFKYTTMKGINGRLIWDTWHQMKGLFRAGMDVSPVITHKFKFPEFLKAMETMRSGNSGKVVLYVD